ncbi:MAG: hypothetical protein QM599_12735 [Pseudoxanthomonas sp.]
MTSRCGLRVWSRAAAWLRYGEFMPHSVGEVAIHYTAGVKNFPIRYAMLPMVLAVALLACQARDSADKAAQTLPIDSPIEGGAVSTAPLPEHASKPATPSAKPKTPEKPAGIDWSPRELAAGVASIACDLDYAANGDGEPLLQLDKPAVTAALEPCKENGVLRLRYVGKINADFTTLMQRITAIADELKIGKRVLDIDSTGGIVEEAIKAGDRIAESGWTQWVREGSQCHSACVFILAAADTRVISGRVGIHRIIRMSSTASSRAELNQELHAVYDDVRAYLERNGAAVAVADQMMAVPNRNLRLLSADELRLYGLDGPNPAQDDLDRLRLMRQCGEDFVSRRDAFARAFDARCRKEETALEAISACGLELRAQFGFPDARCPAESPMSEYDTGEARMADASDAKTETTGGE